MCSDQVCESTPVCSLMFGTWNVFSRYQIPEYHVQQYQQLPAGNGILIAVSVLERWTGQVIVVTEEFEGKALLARHRMVNALFKEELMGKTPAMHGERRGTR